LVLALVGLLLLVGDVGREVRVLRQRPHGGDDGRVLHLFLGHWVALFRDPHAVVLIREDFFLVLLYLFCAVGVEHQVSVR